MSTNTPDPQNPLAQQQMWEPGSTPSQSHKQLPSPVKWGLQLLLFYLIGPVLLFAEGIQEDAAGPMWQAEKRWANVNGSAFLWLLFYIPIAIFHAPLAAFWTSIFITFAQWFHLPVLAWLGGTSIVPPLPSGTLLRWFLSFPLAGLLAIIRETLYPQTTWETKRVLTSDEQVEVAAAITARAKKKIAATQKTSTVAATPAPKKPKPRTPAKPKTVQHPIVPKADSLWGSIDWKSVADTHPVKQAALQEARDLEAKQQEDKRSQWLAQQRASLQMPQSPPIVDSTLASPTPAPSSPSAQTATPEEKEYNWDEGNGSIQA
jgi:hypothetical protein